MKGALDMSNTRTKSKTNKREQLIPVIVKDAVNAGEAADKLAVSVRSFIVADTRYKTYDADKRREIAAPVKEAILNGMTVREARDNDRKVYRAYEAATKAFNRFWQNLDKENAPEVDTPEATAEKSEELADHETTGFDPTGLGLADSVIGHIVQVLNYSMPDDNDDAHAYYVSALEKLHKELKVKPSEIK
jgi:hypothetical protein